MGALVIAYHHMPCMSSPLTVHRPNLVVQAGRHPCSIVDGSIRPWMLARFLLAVSSGWVRSPDEIRLPPSAVYVLECDHFRCMSFPSVLSSLPSLSSPALPRALIALQSHEGHQAHTRSRPAGGLSSSHSGPPTGISRRGWAPSRSARAGAKCRTRCCSIRGHRSGLREQTCAAPGLPSPSSGE